MEFDEFELADQERMICVCIELIATFNDIYGSKTGLEL
jgi:hypothetical protein